MRSAVVNSADVCLRLKQAPHALHTPLDAGLMQGALHLSVELSSLPEIAFPNSDEIEHRLGPAVLSKAPSSNSLTAYVTPPKLRTRIPGVYRYHAWREGALGARVRTTVQVRPARVLALNHGEEPLHLSSVETTSAPGT
eukprot:262-Rhodomonas_salina.1